MIADERARRMRRGSLAGVMSRAVSLVTGLVTVPLLLSYLGPERFGIWATVTSLTALLSFTDLGLSNGLVNAIADADAVDDRHAMQADLSSAVVLLLTVSVALIVAVIVVSQFINLGHLFSSTDTGAATGAVWAFVIAFAIGIPVGCVQRLQMGLQEGQTANTWYALGSVLGVLGNVTVVASGGSLALTVAATTGGPVIAAAGNALVLLGFKRPWLRPRLNAATVKRMRELLGSGMLFFITQVAIAISYQSDALVISHVLGSKAVTRYAVPMKLFYFAPVVQSFALLPLWPAVRNAMAQRDFQWAKAALKRSMLLSCGAILLVTTVLVIAGPFVIRIWTGGQVHPGLGLLIALALWALTTCLITPLAYFLAGAGAVPLIAICYGVMAPLNLGLSILGAHAYGVAGVPGASVVADTVCVLVPIFVVFRSGLWQKIVDGGGPEASARSSAAGPTA